MIGRQGTGRTLLPTQRLVDIQVRAGGFVLPARQQELDHRLVDGGQARTAGPVLAGQLKGQRAVGLRPGVLPQAPVGVH